MSNIHYTRPPPLLPLVRSRPLTQADATTRYRNDNRSRLRTSQRTKLPTAKDRVSLIRQLVELSLVSISYVTDSGDDSYSILLFFHRRYRGEGRNEIENNRFYAIINTRCAKRPSNVSLFDFDRKRRLHHDTLSRRPDLFIRDEVCTTALRDLHLPLPSEAGACPESNAP